MSKKRLEKAIEYLKGKNRILLITTSSRWKEDRDEPKSSSIARYFAEKLGSKARLIDAAKLKIYECEGNVSSKKGNLCGEKKALLKDFVKNPSRCHRCYASIRNKDDELWIISKELLESDAIVFFGSVRWGQMNSVYQKLIERLTWLENRHTTLKEDNLLENKDVGLIAIGHNWNGAEVIKLQKKVLAFFGFKTPEELFWNWQYTFDENTETAESYRNSWARFISEFDMFRK